MKKKIVCKPVTQTVSRHFFEHQRLVASEESDTERLEILAFETEHVSNTSVKMGLTVNPGNYESIRCDVMTTVPHYTEEGDEAFAYAVELTERRIQTAFGDQEPLKLILNRVKGTLR